MLKGKVHKYGANVDTDAIIPARYLNVSEAELLAEHCMEDIDLDFVKSVKPGDIIVADTNFGCGSSREHAPLAHPGPGLGVHAHAAWPRDVLLPSSVGHILDDHASDEGVRPARFRMPPSRGLA